METLPRTRAKSWAPKVALWLGLAAGVHAAPSALPEAPEDATGHRLTVDLAVSLPGIASPQLSPDGTRVAFVVSETDLTRNARSPRIWIVPADGSGPARAYTAAGATAPRWSPDGAWLAFLSARADGDRPAGRGNQVFVLSTDGGEARRVTSLEGGVRAFDWSPDGLRLVCVARTGPGSGDGKASGRGSDDTPLFRRYSRSTYKNDGTGYADGRRSHLFIVDVATGGARQITRGDDWDDVQPRFSPDGKRIAFVSDRTTGAGGFETWKDDVWIVSTEGGEPERVTANPFVDADPEWSPDGARLAWLGHPAENEYARVCIAAADRRDVEMDACTEVPFFSFSLQWAEKGRALYIDVGDRGDFRTVRFDAAARTHRAVSPAGVAARGVHVADAAGRLTYRASEPRQPDAIHVAALGGGAGRPLTDLGRDRLAGLALSDVERFVYRSVDDWEVEAFLMRPHGFVPSRRYPMVLAIHGGPGGMYGAEWSPEFQLYAASGYAVLYLNPRGSSGYGRAFQRGVEREWGGKAYVDLMNGVDAALARSPWIDPDRLVVTGTSYGGFMTNWIVTRTRRFKAAVSLAGISNLVSIQGTRDMVYSHRLDFGGDLYQSPELYWRYSPVQHAEKVTTPILLVHGERDMRVPLEQSEQFFRALKLHGRTAELMILPRASHSILQAGPREMAEVTKARLAWFERFLVPAAAAP